MPAFVNLKERTFSVIREKFEPHVERPTWPTFKVFKVAIRKSPTSYLQSVTIRLGAIFLDDTVCVKVEHLWNQQTKDEHCKTACPALWRPFVLLTNAKLLMETVIAVETKLDLISL